MTDVGSALESLTQALKKRERELDERESELSEQQKRLKTEIISAYGDTSPSDVIHLNIGGKRLDVLRRTLCSVEGSMLASKFSGRWDDSLEKDRDGNFFIDENFDRFNTMIDCLRKKAIATEDFPYSAPDRDADFDRMLNYYNITEGIYPVTLKEIYCPPDIENAVTLTEGNELRVDTKELCSFHLQQVGHSRGIESLELHIGEIQCLQVGMERLTRSASRFKYSQNLGVGDLRSTFALDAGKSCFLNGGTRTNLEKVEFKEGTIIRVELRNPSKWYVDGELVARDDAKVGDIEISKPDNWHSDRFVLSIKGNLKVKNVKYNRNG